MEKTSFSSLIRFRATVPLERRLNVIAKRKMKTVSEVCREAALVYAEAEEARVKNKSNGAK